MFNFIKFFFCFTLLFFFSCNYFSPSKVKNESNPNIILILLDDMGFSDISSYGGDIKTPNIDSLAKDGLLFSQFYNNGRCCPTRATLNTGLYPQQVGLGYMAESTSTKKPVGENYKPKGYEKYANTGYQGFLNKKCLTIAQVLKPLGYHTFLSGKWHLGYYDKESRPLQRGFDRFYGFLQGTISFFHPSHKHTFGRGLTLGDKSIELGNEKYYTTDAITNYAIKFIKEAREKDDNPFFLYLSYNAPHFPLQAKKENYEKYLDSFSKGWDFLRPQRLARMKEKGIVSDDTRLSKTDGGLVRWASLTKKEQKKQAQTMAVYAGMIDSIDENIGKLLAFLKEQKMFDNTLIMFLSDNGASGEGGRLGRGNLDAMLNGQNYYEFRNDLYSKAWANYSNTPFKLYKSHMHEGGIATPFILHWNKGLKGSMKGTIYKKPLHIIDIMDTIVDITGAYYPDTFQGYKILPKEGRSFAPILQGENVQDKPVFIEHRGSKAIRKGNWKLVYHKHRKKWELYNIAKDRTERLNLIKTNLDVARQLYDLWEKWAIRMEVNIYPPSKFSRQQFNSSIK